MRRVLETVKSYVQIDFSQDYSRKSRWFLERSQLGAILRARSAYHNVHKYLESYFIPLFYRFE